MSRGRKADPAEVQAAKGNPGKRADRAPVTADVPAIDGDAPADLGERETIVWRKLHEDLGRLKMLRATDEWVLKRYCGTLVQYARVSDELKERGEVYDAATVSGGTLRRIEPLFVVQQHLAKRLESMEDRLGLNPRARYEILHRLSTAAPPTPPDPSQPYEGNAPSAPGAIGFLLN